MKNSVIVTLLSPETLYEKEHQFYAKYFLSRFHYKIFCLYMVTASRACPTLTHWFVMLGKALPDSPSLARSWRGLRQLSVIIHKE